MDFFINVPFKLNLFCSIETIKEWCEQAKQLEKEQIENAYDAGIKALDSRGGVISRAWTDFDEYYQNEYENKNE